MGKKIISFCLWGDNPKYTIGALKNAFLAKQIYEGWICRFYVGRSTPPEITSVLEQLDNTEVIRMEEEGNWEGMFWRFYAAGDPTVSVMLSRDTDCRLSYREKAAVDEWLQSDKDFHMMRDHGGHQCAIMGGMWGCRNGILSHIKDLIDACKKGDFWQVDQRFLENTIYPIIKDNCFEHDEFFPERCKNQHPFPVERLGTSRWPEVKFWKGQHDNNPIDFIGKPFEANDINKDDGTEWNPSSVYK